MNLPLGFRYAAAYAGIRKQEQNDIALIVCDEIAQAAAVFTQNVIQAAPVRLARKNLKSSKGRVAAILTNAGNANCATRTGDRVTLASCKAAAKALKTRTEYILPASTGVIGVELDPKLLISAIPKLMANLSPARFEAVAAAILTTDTHIKIASEEVQLAKGVVRVAGMTKGAGMIHPNMATTLGFVLTDAALEAKELRKMLLSATAETYNSLTVDGDTSTNDMVALLASGASKIQPAAKDLPIVQEAIRSVMENLARQIAADGEGARKLILIQVEGFSNLQSAQKIARSIANSPLVKTAIAGSDPNWGRILAAAGYAGVEFNQSKIDIYLQAVPVCRAGIATNFDESQLQRLLDRRDIEIRVVSTRGGKGKARFFSCDLTEGYIRINGSYRT